jgi:hypothetical protein
MPARNSYSQQCSKYAANEISDLKQRQSFKRGECDNAGIMTTYCADRNGHGRGK